MSALDVIVTMPEWFRLANCAGTDPEAFHPPEDHGQGSSPRAAKTICARCPIVDLCGEYALERPYLSGVWGGLTDRERATMRAARRRTIDRQRKIDGEPPTDAGADTLSNPVYAGVHGRYGPGGAAWHRRHGQTPCDPCLAAEARYNEDKRARRPRPPRDRTAEAQQRATTRQGVNGGPGGFARYMAAKEAG